MEITENGAYSHKILGEVLSKYQYLEKKERAFITRVTEGTLEHLIEIDYILDQFSKVKVKKMKPVIRNILRSGVYQLKYMDSVPDHAVCSEAVKLAVRKGFSGLKGYVNGVLRSVARGLDTLDYPQEGIEHFQSNILFRHGFSGCGKKVMGRKSPVPCSRFPERKAGHDPVLSE